MLHQEFIAARRAGLAQIKQVLHQHFYFADEDLMQQRLAPNKWSIVEHLAHINLANYHYIDQFQPEKGIPSRKKENPQVSHSLLGQALIWGMREGQKGKPAMKLPAPKAFIPVSITHPEVRIKDRAAFGDFLAVLEKVASICDAFLDLDYKKVKFVTAIAPWPTINLYDALVIMEVHTLRHLKAMVEIKEVTV
jgi:hypothetical protein